jgi:hypothetical protein
MRAMQAIGEAASRPSMRFVAVKSTAQQDVQASDRHFQTWQVGQARGGRKIDHAKVRISIWARGIHVSPD